MVQRFQTFYISFHSHIQSQPPLHVRTGEKIKQDYLMVKKADHKGKGWQSYWVVLDDTSLILHKKSPNAPPSQYQLNKSEKKNRKRKQNKKKKQKKK